MRLGVRRPERLGAAARTAMGAYARPVPSMVVHGLDDGVVDPRNARQVLAQSMVANHLAGAPALDPGAPTTVERGRVPSGLPWVRSLWEDAQGRLRHELLEVDGLGHAWSGGEAGAGHADPRGPDATSAIWRFFERAARVPGRAAG
jgi:poly(3-hydroxybutyrate) depolymerase